MPRGKAAKPKAKTNTKVGVAETSKRLTEDQKAAIAADTSGNTLAELAKKFNTSVNTIMKYRAAGKTASAGGKAHTATTATASKTSGTARSATPNGLTFTVDGADIVFRVPRTNKQLLRNIVGDLFD